MQFSSTFQSVLDKLRNMRENGSSVAQLPNNQIKPSIPSPSVPHFQSPFAHNSSIIQDEHSELDDLLDDYDSMATSTIQPLRQTPSSTIKRSSPITHSVQHSIADVTHQRPASMDPFQFLNSKFPNFFKYPSLNTVQTTTFSKLFETDNNVVVSAPTGSGKTTLFEFALLRMLEIHGPNKVRAIYIAPIKALCQERVTDWKEKFSKLKLKVFEVTGDSGEDSLATKSGLVVTTPEKIDFVTRRLRGTSFHNVNLVIIDEVHHLNEPKRGPVLEAVISRLKLNSSPRFVAASATIPNINEVGSWLGAESSSIFVFGEEHRPVPLEKVVIGVPSKNNNAFVFDKFLDYKLFDLISKYSPTKPVLIFCSTRKSAQAAASKLSSDAHGFFTSGSSKPQLTSLAGQIQDKHLATVFLNGIATHSAALSHSDRSVVEKGFLDGIIRVVCCTSTLSIGINLPCFCAIIKGTNYYNPATSSQKEYTTLSILQMIGRSGRPQFDTSAISVILTTPDRTNYFSRITSGQETVESQLSEHLTEHLNAEVAAGIITNMNAAVLWVKSTFFYQRLQIHGQETVQLEQMISQEIQKLIDVSLVKWVDSNSFTSTELGKIASKHYVSFATISDCLALSSSSTLHDLLLMLADSDELNGHVLRNNEKRDLNSVIHEDFVIFKPSTPKVKTTADKIVLLLQCAAFGFSFDSWSLRSDMQIIQQKMTKLLKTIAELFLAQEGLDLGRFRFVKEIYLIAKALEKSVWPPPNSKNHQSTGELKQIQGVGPAISNLLNNSGIYTLKQLAQTDPRRVEFITNRNAPFGSKLVNAAKQVPDFELNIVKSSRKMARDQTEIQVGIRSKFGTFPKSLLVVGNVKNDVVLYRWIKSNSSQFTESFIISSVQSVRMLKVAVLVMDWVNVDQESIFNLITENDESLPLVIDLNRCSTIGPPQTKTCGHRCRDKSKCRHACCKINLEQKSDNAQQEKDEFEIDLNASPSPIKSPIKSVERLHPVNKPNQILPPAKKSRVDGSKAALKDVPSTPVAVVKTFQRNNGLNSQNSNELAPIVLKKPSLGKPSRLFSANLPTLPRNSLKKPGNDILNQNASPKFNTTLVKPPSLSRASPVAPKTPGSISSTMTSQNFNLTLIDDF
ncbi:hypothetical protein P9112_011120 [Eukaryota sp. TZLM1-RC]